MLFRPRLVTHAGGRRGLCASSMLQATRTWPSSLPPFQRYLPFNRLVDQQVFHLLCFPVGSPFALLLCALRPSQLCNSLGGTQSAVSSTPQGDVCDNVQPVSSLRRHVLSVAPSPPFLPQWRHRIALPPLYENWLPWRRRSAAGSASCAAQPRPLCRRACASPPARPWAPRTSPRRPTGASLSSDPTSPRPPSRLASHSTATTTCIQHTVLELYCMLDPASSRPPSSLDCAYSPLIQYSSVQYSPGGTEVGGLRDQQGQSMNSLAPVQLLMAAGLGQGNTMPWEAWYWWLLLWVRRRCPSSSSPWGHRCTSSL